MLKFLNHCYYSWLSKLFFRGRTGLEDADAALRYLPISDIILGSAEKSPFILEVGSGCTGITPYIPYPITGVDVSFEGQVASNLTPVVLSGESLPFGDASFDYVISVDMLEHVAHDLRPIVLGEFLRLARKRIFLAVPCGADSEEHDRLLNECYTARHGEPYTFLVEHVENGLPGEQELTQLIEEIAGEMGIKVRIRVMPNVNLKVREWFSRIWIGSSKAYGIMSPIICIFRYFYNFGSCYRRIFVVEINAGE